LILRFRLLARKQAGNKQYYRQNTLPQQNFPQADDSIHGHPQS
jgi:hypothetical protein